MRRSSKSLIKSVERCSDCRIYLGKQQEEQEVIGEKEQQQQKVMLGEKTHTEQKVMFEEQPSKHFV